MRPSKVETYNKEGIMKHQSKIIFEMYNALAVWETSSENNYQIIDNDLYFYDPHCELGISLGNLGDGWVCIYEDIE